MKDKLTGIYYGGDYNPEQRSESVWQEDMRLMKKAGVNFVSLGIFSWALLEPQEGVYVFDWLDKIIDLLYENKIYVNLSTATAAQPAWMTCKYDDILPVNKDGLKLSYASRQSYCPNSPSYKKGAARLVRTIASRYKDHPALRMWHINNEFGCHTAECYCDNCAQTFREWLKARYLTLDKLNAAWGTKFWSQYYYSWDEICIPKTSTAFINPSMTLDYRRFMSDSLINLYLEEKKIVNEITPAIPVTTNLMNGFKPIDYFTLAQDMDIVALDSYPDPSDSKTYHNTPLQFDLMRGLKNGRPFILMEQAVSHVNWRPVNAVKKPNEMRLMSYQAMAHGADGIMFFQWRQSQRGAEKFHSAMVSHNGDENARGFKEVCQLGNELSLLSELKGTYSNNKAALLFDYDNWWALDGECQPSSLTTYMLLIEKYYSTLFHLNIGVDIVPINSDLSMYDIVVAPSLYMTKPGTKELLESFVHHGGTFVCSFFSGIVDENDGAVYGAYPGLLTNLLGIYVEELNPLNRDEKYRLSYDESHYSCTLWSEKVHLRGASCIGHYESDFLNDSPALTVNSFGCGKAYYISTLPEDSLLEKVLSQIAVEKDISPALSVPKGVEIACRYSDSKQYIFLLNHSLEDQFVQLPASMTYFDMIKQQTVSQGITLASKAIKILR
ncbi:MAG: hypothetical protein K0S71_1537 [Clostridia bacterium]|jgi:beta-galactosidase|nr:hypothetical protein [Clostridia bacterium]